MATPSQQLKNITGMAQADPTGVLAQALAKYPSVAGLITQPGIMDMLMQASSNNWTPNELMAHLETTPYWQNTTAEKRQWDMLVATDPTTANARWNAGANHVNQVAQKLGVTMSNAMYSGIMHAAIQNAWTDDTLTSWLLGAYKFDPKHLPAGDLGGSMTQVKSIAASYGMSVSPQTAVHSAIALLEGKADAASTAEYFKNQAISAYGHNKALVDALNRGVTVKDYSDPYIQLASQELGTNPADINLSNPKWNKFLTTTDPKTGASMNLDQWRATLRSDPVYGYDQTANARDQAAQLADQLGKRMGAVA